MPLTLTEWLQHLESLHPKVIQLGLDRVLSVKAALGITQTIPLFIALLLIAPNVCAGVAPLKKIQLVAPMKARVLGK